MQSPLDPLDLVKHSARFAQPPTPSIDINALAKYLEEIAQEAANLVNADPKREFLYKNPYGWKFRREHFHVPRTMNDSTRTVDSYSTSSSILTPSISSYSDDDYVISREAWRSIRDYQFQVVVQQINEFILSWELNPATKFVVIGLNKSEDKSPFGMRYFVNVQFSNPTVKCPNPLAVAKAYFQINVSRLLPKYYPVNITYKFEGYESQFYALGEYKLSSNRFQRYYIDSILQLKLAFYAKICECRHPLKPLAKSEQSGKLITL